MLFKFKSSATADLIMLEADARRLLQILLNEEAPVKGIVQWQKMPAAVESLQRAVQADEECRREWAERRNSGALNQDSDANAPEAVRLGQRAQPMIKMLQRCLHEQADMYWGV